MMGFFIGLLTFIMVLDCFVLIFLVLIQLPKKEAGAGLAFGGAATDALFGAGSGTVLTKITKYAAGIFFVLAIILAMLNTYWHNQPGSEFRKLLSQQPGKAAATAGAPAPTATQPGATPTLPNAGAPGSNALMSAPAAGSNALMSAPAAGTTTPAPKAEAPAPAPTTPTPAPAGTGK